MKWILEIDTVCGTFDAPVNALSPRIPRGSKNALLHVRPEWVNQLQPYCSGKPQLVTLRKIKSGT